MSTGLFSPAVSMLQHAACEDVRDVNVHTAITAIRSDQYKVRVANIRKLYQRTLAETKGDHRAAKKAVDKLKKRLPGIMWSGRFNARGDEHLVEYSGLLCADLDKLEPERMRAAYCELTKDPHVWCAFTSPTGTGLKVVFRVAGGADQHPENFESVKTYVATTYDLAVDESCSNLERLCFVSHDPGAFYNNNAEPLPPLEVSAPLPSREPSKIPCDRRQIAEKLLGPIRWQTEDQGLCECAGKHLHSAGNGDRDCMVLLAGVPTVKCFHDSCKGVNAGINHELRSQIGKAEVSSNGSTTTVVLTDKQEKETEFDYANRLAEKLPPIKTCGNRWHAYRAGAWHEIERSTLRPDAQNILPPIIRTARRESSLLDHLEGRFQTDPDSFAGFYKLTEYGAVLINASNCVVKVASSGEVALQSHSPEHAFTKKLAANYDPEAKAPLFERILGEALSDPMDRMLLQLCAGNFLFPDCRFETALVCYGEAGRGKSTIAEPIASALGDSLVPRLTMSQICDPKSYHVPKLRHAAVNLGTELDAVELGDSATFKAIVSGEAIEARPIYDAPFTMSTTCKLWFLANSLPRFKHGTEAELRRTRFLRFDYLPPNKDVTLKAKLAQERDGVFRWMLEGLAEVTGIPHIPLGGRHSQQVHDRFRISNDPIGAFVGARCQLHPSASATKEVLRGAFKEFCEQHDLSTRMDEWFLRNLYERWPQLREIRPREDDGQRRRVITGIGVNP